MTFKHITFSDSPIMRSLERVAREKGLVKPESLKKEASSFVKKSYKTSNNLMQDLMTLCAGLRDKGYDDYAEELESHVLAYKFAAQDAGEKMIQNSHPEGSPKLDVLGDSVVENIIDQHLAMLKVVNKEPTGKLSTASDILKAVKTVLAQGVPFGGAWDAMNSAYESALNLNKLSKIDVSKFEKARNSLSLEDILQCRDAINTFDKYNKPTLLTGASKEIWLKMLPDVKNIINNLALAESHVRHPVDRLNELYKSIIERSNNLIGQIDSLKVRFAGFGESHINFLDKLKIKVTEAISKAKEAFNAKSFERLQEADTYLKIRESKMNEFKNNWARYQKEQKEKEMQDETRRQENERKQLADSGKTNG